MRNQGTDFVVSFAETGETCPTNSCHILYIQVFKASALLLYIQLQQLDGYYKNIAKRCSRRPLFTIYLNIIFFNSEIFDNF